MITFVYRYSGTEWKIAIAGEKMGIFVARDKRIPYGRIEFEENVPLNERPRLAMGEDILSIVWRSA